ncbi:MAG: ZIP family metal transporter, partial [Christensenella sp.]
MAVAWAAGGTGFTFLMTVFGAALVFLFKKDISTSF